MSNPYRPSDKTEYLWIFGRVTSSHESINQRVAAAMNDGWELHDWRAFSGPDGGIYALMWRLKRE